MQRLSFVLVLLLLAPACFTPNNAAYADEEITYNWIFTDDHAGPESSELAQLDKQQEILSGSAIPRIGGTWDMAITGFLYNGIPHTIKGTHSFITHIAPDGHEVLTSMHREGYLYDPQGRVIAYDQESRTIANGKITSTSFTITTRNGTSAYTIHNSSLITQTILGTDIHVTLTRGGSGGGGCSTGGVAPLAVLLLLPALLLNSKKTISRMKPINLKSTRQ